MIFENPTNLTRVNELITVADGFTGGMLGLLIYIIVGFGTFLLTSQFNSRESMIATSFVLLIVSFLLKYMFGILGDIYVYVSAVLFIGAIIFGFLSKETPGA